MLILGSPTLLPYYWEEMVVFNFTSFSLEYEKINVLPPPVQQIGDFDYDMYFAQWILNNKDPFAEFMKVIYNLYEGHTVYLCINDILENINESLLKLIQQRYGYVGNLIHAPEDFQYLTEGSFSIEGLSNLDSDKMIIANNAMIEIAANGNRPVPGSEYSYAVPKYNRDEYSFSDPDPTLVRDMMSGKL